jgi:hypothetical protein
MKKVLIIIKWFFTITLLVVLVLFSNARQTTQIISLGEIIINESSDNFINKKIVFDFFK